MPDAVHGASSRMRSNERSPPASLQVSGCAASPITTRAVKMTTTKVVGDARGASAIDLECSQIGRAQFGQMRGLAARRSAGIEHPHAGLRVEPGRGQLRAGVLHRHVAFGKARNRVHRPRLMQPDCLRADLRRFDAALRQSYHVVVAPWFVPR